MAPSQSGAAQCQDLRTIPMPSPPPAAAATHGLTTAFAPAWLSGGVAGCVAKTATAPLTRLTVLAQTATLRELASDGRHEIANGGIVRALRKLSRDEGLMALWRGNAWTCVHRFPFAGVNFAMFELCSKELSRRGASQKSPFFAFVPGAVAGFTGVIVCYPLEVLRTRLMVDLQIPGCTKGGWKSAWYHWTDMRRDGVLKTYRGVGLALAVSGPAVSISFGVYTWIQQLFENRRGSTSCASTLVAGGLSGMAASAVTFPLDTLRRRSQASRSVSWLVDLKGIWHESRGLGLLRGIQPEMLKAFPTVALTYLVYECLR